MFRLHVFLILHRPDSQFVYIYLQGLNWNLSPITANSWLNIYLQLSCLGSKTSKTSNFNIPNYSQQQFVQVTQVCILVVCVVAHAFAVLLMATMNTCYSLIVIMCTGISHSMGLCVLKASAVKSPLIISINTQSTSRLILSQH